MGFREDLEKDKEQKEKQRMERAHYKKVCQQVPYINIDDKTPNADEGYEKCYKNTLKVNLTSQQQEIIDEAIEFLEGWQALPTEIDEKEVYWQFLNKNFPIMTLSPSELNTTVTRKAAHSRRSYGFLTWDNMEWQVKIGYTKNNGDANFHVKYKWSDGSIHHAICRLSECAKTRVINGEELGKMFQERKVLRIMQEMESSYLQELQKELNMYSNHMRDGSQEYVSLCYSREDYGSQSLCIFRDGTVFDYMSGAINYKSPCYPLSGDLYGFLLEKIKRGKEQYSW